MLQQEIATSKRNVETQDEWVWRDDRRRERERFVTGNGRSYYLPMERLEYIRSVVQEEGSVRVADLSRRLKVSEATVRNDLAQLEQAGLVKRTYGGAMAVRGTRYERSFREQEAHFRAEKGRIAEAAVKLIRSGQLVLLDVGTTTTEIARRLPDLENLVVCTSALNIAVELERCTNVTVMVTGGTVRYMQHSLVNPLGTLLISKINADLLFLGCNGVSAEHGVTNANLPEAEVKQAMVRAAKEVVVVADSSKIGNVAAAHVVPLSEVDRLITDDGADPEEIERVRKAGVEVTLV